MLKKNSENCATGCQGNCCSQVGGKFTPSEQRTMTVALVGQPNTGKSTLFNMLTGSNQHVGNWPGKTVEKKEGVVEVGDQTIHVYDLPGTYSLTANSLEEVITRDFLILEQPDVVVVVVDAGQLERSMYMLSEVVPLGITTIVALNKMDMAENQGYELNLGMFEQLTGLVTIPIIASKNQGITELLEAVVRIGGDEQSSIFRESLPGVALPHYDEILALVNGKLPSGYSGAWLTTKLLEGDTKVTGLMGDHLSPESFTNLKSFLSPPEEAQLTMAKVRYEWLGDLLPCLIVESAKHYKRGRFDVAATHPIWGKLIALASLFIGIVAAYIISIPLMIPGFTLFFLSDPLQQLLTGFAPQWICYMIGDGLLGGLSIASIVLGFIGGVFIVLGFLENSGYLARLAYCFDPYMHRIGLHGKSIMPIIMGFVCNIIGVSGSRIIDTWKQRLVTLVIAPIIPCKGLFMVIGFVTAVFFGAQTLLVFFGLTLVTIAYLSLTSVVLHKYILKGDSSGLIMELPPYHRPSCRNIRIFAILRMKMFYYRGFWFIVSTSLFAWFGIYFPTGSIDTSYLAVFGKKLEFFGQVVGWDWRFCIAFIIAFFSKEATLGAMAVIFSASTAGDTDLIGIAMDEGLWEYIRSGDFGSFLATTGLTRASALSFIFAVFFSLPCFGTLAAIWAETKSIPVSLGALLYYFTMSIIMGGLAYLFGLIFL